MCRRVLCPLFHVRTGQTCSSNINFNELPKLAIIRFHELNKTAKVQNPYRNFEKDIIPIVENDILITVFFWLNHFNRILRPPPRFLMNSSYMNFYQRQGVNESDFVLEYAWLSVMDVELVPEAFKRLFDTINVSIPIPHTSSLFEAKSITKFAIHGENIKIDHVTYKRIFRRDYAGFWGFYLDANTRYLQMNPLILCNRVSLSLSGLTISDTSFHRHSSDIAVALPEHYIITDSFIEMCADDYFHLTAQALKSNVGRDSNSLDKIEEIAIVLSFVCSCISIICLLITIATYLLFDSLRSLPGKINLCLCVFLLIAQILQQFTIDLIDYKIVCIVFGVLIHFSWSATLCWMSVSSFNLFRCFSSSNISRHDSSKSLGLYATFVVVMSTLLVVANMAYSLVGECDFGYGKRICYISSELGLLLTFVIPVGVIVLSNMVFLSVTIWRISHIPKLKGEKSVERNNVIIYMKMSTLTGACWIFGFLRILTEVDVFEILFILANASQGLFLMISFVCNQRVLGLFKELLSR